MQDCAPVLKTISAVTHVRKQNNIYLIFKLTIVISDEDRCKSQGGQCETKCQGKRTKDNTPDCKDLGMECCIYF